MEFDAGMALLRMSQLALSVGKHICFRHKVVAQMYWDLLRRVKIRPSQLASDHLLKPPSPDVGHRSNRNNDTQSRTLHWFVYPSWIARLRTTPIRMS